MAKLKLTASPTFKAKVAIPVPGSKPVDVEFTFKAMTRDKFKEFVEGLEGRKDEDVILDIASGWELEDPFGAETVAQLNQNYMGSARSIISTFIEENTGARLGNFAR